MLLVDLSVDIVRGGVETNRGKLSEAVESRG